MDEAMGMGQGTYFQKHGYRDRLELMREHMDRVMEICGRYDVEPMIWSDMYLRSVCGGEYYGAPRMEAFTDELKPPGIGYGVLGLLSQRAPDLRRVFEDPSDLVRGCGLPGAHGPGTAWRQITPRLLPPQTPP